MCDEQFEIQYLFHAGVITEYMIELLNYCTIDLFQSIKRLYYFELFNVYLSANFFLYSVDDKTLSEL